MPVTYEKLGITFEYPDNWRLEEDTEADAGDSVTVYSPGGGFWMFRFEQTSADPEELVKHTVSVMREEYGNLDEEAVTDSVGERLLAGADLNFYCLDLTSTAQVRALRTSRGVCLILCQAEDREFDRVAPVFDAMTASLLSHV